MDASIACTLCEYANQCPLAEAASNVNVASEGADDPEVLILGMNPGEQEDKANRPFVGPSGQLLRDVLDEVLFPEDKGRISNAVKCVHWTDTVHSSVCDPPELAITLCKNNLLKEIEGYKNLKYIITLGGLATSIILPEVKEGISRLIGKPQKTTICGRVITVIPNFHPSYLLRGRSDSPDMQRFRDVFSQVASFISRKESLFKTKVLDLTGFIEYSNFLLQNYRDGKLDKVFFDLETSNPWAGDFAKINIWQYKIVSMSFADPITRMGYFIGVCHPELKNSEEDQKMILAIAAKILQTIPVGNHNVKFDLNWMIHHSPLTSFTIAEDSIIAAYLYYGKDSGISLGLKNLVRMVLKTEEAWEETLHQQVYSFRLIKDRNLYNVPLETISRYGAVDPIASLMLSEALNKKLEEKGLIPIYREILRSLAIFAALEVRGIRIDKELLALATPAYNDAYNTWFSKLCNLPMVGYYLSSEYSCTDFKVVNDNGKWIVRNNTTGKDCGFSVGSTDQMCALFFSPRYYKCVFDNKFKTEPTKLKPQGGMSFDKEVRKDLLKRVDGEVKAALEYVGVLKSITSALTKYYNPLPLQSATKIVSESGVEVLSLKPDFNFTSAATGRMGSNFHTVPRKGEVKRLFISDWAESGGVMMTPDFSQIEIRVIGALAKDENLRDTYIKGFDVHRYIASIIFKIPYEQVNKTQRSYAKTIVFGILYQKADFSLAEELKIPIEEAQKLQAWFYEGFPKLKIWVEQIKLDVKAVGHVQNVFGFYRYFPNYKSTRRGIIGEVEREAVNFPVQSTAYFTALRALTDLANNFINTGMKSRVVGMVHDSIICDIYPTEVFQALRSAKYYLIDKVNSDNAYWLNGMPLSADFSFGRSWMGSFEFGPNDIELIDGGMILNIKGKEWDISSTVEQLKKNYSVSILDITPTDEKEDNTELFKGVFNAGSLVGSKIQILGV